jgi:hypothetical protein
VTSSVFFAIAFLYQTSKTGLVRAAVDRLTGKPLFSYGISDQGSGLEVKKPDGSDGLVPFDYLKKNTAPPFSVEWGGAGIDLTRGSTTKHALLWCLYQEYY